IVPSGVCARACTALIRASCAKIDFTERDSFRSPRLVATTACICPAAKSASLVWVQWLVVTARAGERKIEPQRHRGHRERRRLRMDDRGPRTALVQLARARNPLSIFHPPSSPFAFSVSSVSVWFILFILPAA